MISGVKKSFPFILLGISALWISCSNTKDTVVNRFFHNLSAHYNGYYNAGLKLEDGLDKLATSHVDHYDRILKIFQYADVEKAKAIYPQLEDAMKRTSTSISRHTIIDKRGNEKPESEKWIDDNWILYGKCQFFKHDYFEAMETFKYVEVTYKKESGRHVASMWIAKIYLELTQLREAEEKLDYLRNQNDFPKKSLWELEAVNADFYLQTKNYDKAAQHLTRAVALVKNRETKLRWMFILAQLHQQKGEFKQAFDLYTKVIKMNPKYEMAFNARLSRARCYDSSSGSSENVKKELMKMMKDIKNLEFLDQIYYALAGLAKNEGKQDEQIDYLNKSVRASVNNQNQKALSYLELAKLSYDKPEYRLAQAYYDSTISSLATDYPDYTDILARRNSLTKLVKYMKTIELEDSLQKLAKLKPEEWNRIIDEKLSAEEAQKKKLEEEKQSNQIFDPGGSRPPGGNLNGGGGTSFYWYNTQAISFGFNEFVKKFGERKLEDNWRRSKKDIVSQATEEIFVDTAGGEVVDSAGIANAMGRKEKMLKSIPATEEAMTKSTNKIVEAYYNIGMLYREQLNDLKASVETFEELLRRFPTNKYQVQSYYHLYRMYAKLGNTAKSDYYKNIILTEHAETDYAKIILNPNALVEMANKKSNLEIFYEDTYRKYLNGEYASVISRKIEADVQFPQNILTPKFDLLRTLAIGKTQPLPVFEASLNDIIRIYATDSVKDVAQDILDYIHNRTENTIPDLKGDAPQPVNAIDSSLLVQDLKKFTYMPDTMHYVILILQNIGGPLDPIKLKNKVSDFNSTNFASKGISTRDQLLDHKYRIFIMEMFTDKADALNYSNVMMDNDAVFGNVSSEAYRIFAVSVNNLAEILLQKKTDEYEDFYRDFYR